MVEKQIIFIYSGFSTFVEKDYHSLKKKARVLDYHFIAEKQLHRFFFEYLRMTWFLIKNINKTDILFCWFADYYSFLPALFGKIFRKKTVIIVGGKDAISIPEIEYGIFYKKGLQSLMTAWSYRMADLILPVNKSLIESTNYYVDRRGIKAGVKHFVKNLEADMIEVPTGYDSNKWNYNDKEKKKQKVITIAGAKDLKTFKRKGLDFFIEVAKKMPNVEFVIIGVSTEIHDYIKKDKPNNLIIKEYVKNTQLVNYISDAKVYCQFSLAEGLPNVLCEAMLCECIPVGSNTNGIPDGIGDTGFILEDRDVDQAVLLVQKALNSDDELGKKARQRIIDNFSHEKREQTLYKLLINNDD